MEKGEEGENHWMEEDGVESMLAEKGWIIHELRERCDVNDGLADLS